MRNIGKNIQNKRRNYDLHNFPNRLIVLDAGISTIIFLRAIYVSKRSKHLTSIIRSLTSIDLANLRHYDEGP